MSSELLHKLAEKLGITSSCVLKKAEEYSRRCSAKSTLGLSNYSDVAKSCALLHIACQQLSVSFDKTLTAKLSCLKRPAYLKLLHTLKSLLNESSVPTISSLCCALTISGIAQPASEILTKYRNLAPEGAYDGTQPMYACAAVLAACKLQRVKIDESYLKENCRVKWIEVQRVAKEMMEISKTASKSRKRCNTSDSSGIAFEIEKKSSKLDENVINGNAEEPKDGTEEDEYEAWKRKILGQVS